MSFQTYTLCLISLVDPKEGEQYANPVNEEADSAKIKIVYNIIARKKNYINPIADWEISWKIFCSYDIDSIEALEIW